MGAHPHPGGAAEVPPLRAPPIRAVARLFAPPPSPFARPPRTCCAPTTRGLPGKRRTETSSRRRVPSRCVIALARRPTPNGPLPPPPPPPVLARRARAPPAPGATRSRRGRARAGQTDMRRPVRGRRGTIAPRLPRLLCAFVMEFRPTAVASRRIQVRAPAPRPRHGRTGGRPASPRSAPHRAAPAPPNASRRVLPTAERAQRVEQTPS